MAINPIVFTEKVVRSFLQYQLTAYPFADPELHAQMRSLLSLDATRHSPLLKGPYISLSRPFRQGASVSDLIRSGVFHPHMRERIPSQITHVYGHQEQAIRAIYNRQTTLISTGTGSGKTECFLYPIISKCLELRDVGTPAGISAVIVYPMNALAEDQLARLRSLLAGTGISFGMYVGKTPESESEVTGIRLPERASRADYMTRIEKVRSENRSETVHPPEEICSREVMRTPGRQPRILLTNVKQLELLLTRQRDVELFAGARLDFLVFDEAHTFTGAQGAETACLIRRLRAYCDRSEADTICIATSATIVDQNNPNAARDFASRFFGVPADTVCTVGEAYESEVWLTDRINPAAPTIDPGLLLNECVQAVEEESGKRIRAAYRFLVSEDLKPGDWPDVLYDRLSRNEIVFRLSDALAKPRLLHDLPSDLEPFVERRLTENEILCWLTLGAAARHEGRPLLRPVVHVFIRGISGAVVTFPEAASKPTLWLAAEDEIITRSGDDPCAHFPVTTCTTCGQHYFISLLKDFEFTGKIPGGGIASGASSYWEPLIETRENERAVLIDHLIGTGDDDDSTNKRLFKLYFCRRCGAGHPQISDRCLHCGVNTKMVELYAIRQNKDNPGYLSSCVSCNAIGKPFGSTYREPARPVRATNVADVHVLAQDMIHRAERPRLLIFCDNRQDAAFQAGWMKDHARRFRLRALTADGLRTGVTSISDLALYLDDVLEKSEPLSRALVPEVWQVVRKEGGGGRHEKERQKFLRIQILREITISARNPFGLEPWGRLKIEYDGLSESLPWIQNQSRLLNISPGELCDGIACILDYFRRKRILHDPAREIFTKFWMDGDIEVQQNYLSQFGTPVGTKLRREQADKPEYVLQWISERGDTTLRQIARKWGVHPDDAVAFLEGLFRMLCDQKLLTPVKLKGAKGKPLPGVSGVFQVNADRLRLKANTGVWRCRNCRRRMINRAPHLKCPSWRCDGVIEFLPEDSDNYDLQMLDQGYSMLRPEEHTAMLPHDERERLENLFKGDSDVINTFVCTPTLELGVDIGQLDAILMRNVPPLPANYWQRAGRAGRRHRMAVDFTYCRPVSHDRAYFSEPLKLLMGRIDPPAFNMRNELMVAKHVHATVITRLHQYEHDPSRSSADRESIRSILETCLPGRVSEYLFDNGYIRETPFDLEPLKTLIKNNSQDLLESTERVFRQGWPELDSAVTTPESLKGHIQGMISKLEEVIARLRRRLRWAMEQIKRLNKLREKQASLEPEDDALFRRCDALIKRLKGTERRTRRETEGYDDVNTFGVLAAEGFLPGYGLEVGSILGTAEIPFWHQAAREFALPRPPGNALREYVPGNLIYSNGNRFVARRFHRDIDEDRSETPVFEISYEHRAVKETNLSARNPSFNSVNLETIAVCDVDLMHQSHISDEEDVRFQLVVDVFGIERDQHNGGRAYVWGKQDFQHRRGVRLRLVNVGAKNAIERYHRFGYPVCTICGQSVSPLSSNKQLDHFHEDHKARCGLKTDSIGFYADIVADVISLPSCPDQATAYSVMEALRFAATRVLDMHMEDLQILVIGHVDRKEADGLLWDAMPGGSGLLDQFCDHFSEITRIALEIVENCPSACERSCIDCLQTFRNGHYHKYLNRNLAYKQILEWGGAISFSHEIPSKLPTEEPREGSQPVNDAERRLRHLLLAAGFEEGIRGKQIVLDRAIGTTTPDVFYRAPHHFDDEGICIYLDGLSKHIHGNPTTADQDRQIRSYLESKDYEVISIAVSELSDAEKMRQHFRRLASCLREDALRKSLNDPSWFERASGTVKTVVQFSLRYITPKPEERYRGCLPLVPLKIAAGAFSGPQSVSDDDWEWVEVDCQRTLRRGMFIAQVVGKSMEPAIPDGSYCVFAAPVTGTRQGKTVLVQLHDERDPETGERYTIKRYKSEKSISSAGTWRHIKVTLQPINPDFEPIELTCDDEGTVQVVAELVEVLF